MSTKFATRRPLYVPPPWCTKPPLIPLPPGPYSPIVLFAQVTMMWPNLPTGWNTWTRSFQRIPSIGPNTFVGTSGVGSDVIEIRVDLTPATHTMDVQLIARTVPFIHATAHFNNRPYPDEPYWLAEVADPNFTIPSTVKAWAKLWV